MFQQIHISIYARYWGLLKLFAKLPSYLFETIYVNAAPVLISEASGDSPQWNSSLPVRSVDSSIMRICEFKALSLAEPKLFLFSAFSLFMSNVGQCPPSCILCRNLWRLEVLFRGMFGGKGAGESSYWEAKSECDEKFFFDRIWFPPAILIIDPPVTNIHCCH